MDASIPLTNRQPTSIQRCAEQVQAEQIRLIYRQLPYLVAGAVVSAVLALIVMWGTIQPIAGMAWLLSVMVTYGLLFVLSLRYRRAAPVMEHMHLWGSRLLVLSWPAVLSWGSASYWLYNPTATNNMLLLVFYMALGAASVTVSTIAFRPLFYTCAAMLGPLWIMLLVRPSPLGGVMAMAVVVYAALLVAVHYFCHATLVRALSLQFENRALADALAVNHQQVLEASQAKSRFLAIASHDLSQPLHAQRLFLARLDDQLRRSDGTDTALCCELTARLSTSMAALTGLFTTLLDFSKLESGEVGVGITVFSSSALFEELGDEYALRAHAKGLRLKYRTPDVWLETDRVLLTRALRNLLENAIRYTDRGSILLGARRRGERLRIEVWDTGRGFSEVDIPVMFQEFCQLQPGSGAERGLGLGLAVVRQIGELLDLPIGVHSHAGRGSLFTLSVPLGDTQSAASEARDVTDVQQALGGGGTVLLVEDDLEIQAAMKGLLNSWGLDVLLASNLAEARRLLSDEEALPDCMLVDYQLDATTRGTELIAWARNALSREIPAALLTADTSEQPRNAARDLGCMLLHKPVDPGKLRSLLRSLQT